MTLDLKFSLIWPETLLTALLVLVMCMDMVLAPEKRGRLLGVTAAGLGLILLLLLTVGVPLGQAFHGTFASDPFSIAVKIFLVLMLLSVVLVSRPWQARMGSMLGAHLLLVMASGIGMLALASANDLVLLFVALELATIPLMILTALDRANPLAEEAALKFLITGSVASAFTVFGIALIWGYSGGTTNLQELGGVVLGGNASPALTFGTVLLFAGLGFKTAIAPFHVWVPDVYEGAPTPITAFLAGGSKAAGFAALLRVGAALFGGDPAVFDWPLTLAVLAGLTAILGNMAAMWQKNLKRLLAHASVGHAGFLLLGLAVLGTSGQNLGLTALGYYMAFYALAVALVFFAMGLVSRAGSGEALSDYEGLAKRAPGLTVALLVGVLSMGGIPLTAGFIGKIWLVAAVVKGAGEKTWLFGLAFAAGFAMVLSIVYTLMIMRTLYVAPGRDGESAVAVASWEKAALFVMAALLIVFGVWPAPVMDAVGPVMADLFQIGQSSALIAAAR
jgi:NADH-quinone oxidoreductase subunit N